MPDGQISRPTGLSHIIGHSWTMLRTRAGLTGYRSKQIPGYRTRRIDWSFMGEAQ